MFYVRLVPGRVPALCGSSSSAVGESAGWQPSRCGREARMAGAGVPSVVPSPSDTTWWPRITTSAPPPRNTAAFPHTSINSQCGCSSDALTTRRPQAPSRSFSRPSKPHITRRDQRRSCHNRVMIAVSCGQARGAIAVRSLAGRGGGVSCPPVSEGPSADVNASATRFRLRHHQPINAGAV
jgi:hypothetical protein